MYAVIMSGGKQHRIKAGDKIKVESISQDLGSEIIFENVLMVGEGDSVKVGAPYVADAKVLATVISHGRDKKIKIIKFRRRKHHEKWQGHRQYFTQIEINSIDFEKAKKAHKSKEA